MQPIILIDDEADDLFFATRKLSRAGIRNPVRTFSDGEEAINFLSSWTGVPRPPACAIFTDIKMPRLTGFDVIEWIRKQPAFASISVFALSSSAEQNDKEKAYALGADKYFVKFPTEDELAEAVKIAGETQHIRRNL